jgi:hypothetical protein
LYKFSFPVLVIYVISNLGCLGGHCASVNTWFLQIPDSINVLATFNHQEFFQSVSITDQFNQSSSWRIIFGLIAVITIFPYRNKFKNPQNLFLLVLSVLFVISFICQFQTPEGPSFSLYDRLLGLNIFQWAIVTVNTLIWMILITNEFIRSVRNPRRKIKSPSSYTLLAIYLTIFAFSFRDSSFLTDANLNILAIGFVLTTISLIYYFHKKIRFSFIRYTSILLLLFTSLVFFQAKLYRPEDTKQKDLQKRIINYKTQNGQERTRIVYPSPNMELKQLQFVRFHQLGHKSLTLSTLNTYSDISKVRYTESGFD